MGSFVELTAVDGAKTPAYVAMPEGKPRGAVVGVVTNDLSSAHRGADVVLIGTPDGVVTR